MPLTDTILDALADAHVPLTLTDLDEVLLRRLGTIADENEIDDAIRELLDEDLVAFRFVGEHETPALVPFGEVTR